MWARFGRDDGYVSAGAADWRIVGLIVLVSCAWALCVNLAQYPGYTHFDTLELYSRSRLGFVLNFGPHPPLLPWIVHTLDLVHPVGRHGFALLALVNMGLGAFAIWRIAVLAVGADRAVVALALYGLVPYATFLALKLNHNSILISLWPLTVWAFLACLLRPTALRGVLFGAAAAAGVLAKYYTLVLLFAAFAASLWWPRRKEFYFSPAPYVAVAVFCVLVGPHIYSAYIADAHAFTAVEDQLAYQRRNPLAHALQSAEAAGGAWRLLRSNVLSLVPALLAFAALRHWLRSAGNASRSADREIFGVLCVLCAVSYFVLLVLVAGLRLSASPEWTGPNLALVPLVLAGFLSAPDADQRRRLGRLCIAACCLLPLAGPPILYWTFKRGAQTAVVPRVEIVRSAGEIWRKATGRPLGIIGPEWALANTASIDLAERPFSWPAFDPAVAWITPDMIERHGLLVACVSNDPHCMKAAPPWIAKSAMTCQMRHRRTLWGLQGPELTTTLHLVPPRGVELQPATTVPGCNDLPGRAG